MSLTVELVLNTVDRGECCDLHMRVEESIVVVVLNPANRGDNPPEKCGTSDTWVCGG